MSTNKRTSSPAYRNGVSISTLRNMARVLVASGEFSTIEIDRALRLPDVTSAGFMAAKTRYGKRVLEKRETPVLVS